MFDLATKKNIKKKKKTLLLISKPKKENLFSKKLRTENAKRGSVDERCFYSWKESIAGNSAKSAMPSQALSETVDLPKIRGACIIQKVKTHFGNVGLFPKAFHASPDYF